jgi:acetylornithine aminotransferase/acetylornithine/N-succinyldiaminopimelate aminotransferase
VRFDNVEDLKAKFDDKVCAICLEPVQGEGGIRVVSKKFLQAARTLSQQHGALLIADEIQCGLGRTGKYFAYQHYGIMPDIVTVAKPLAAGLPLGAVLTTEAVSRAIHPGMHGTTFGGGPLACSVAIAFLETLERENLLRHVAEMGDYFKEELLTLQQRHPCIVDVRGMGLMLGAELDSADLAKSVARSMLNAGIIINRTHETVLRFLPPYIVGKKEIDHVIQSLDRALSQNQGRAVAAAQSSQRKETS